MSICCCYSDEEETSPQMLVKMEFPIKTMSPNTAESPVKSESPEPHLKSDSPEPHLVSIASTLTGPIVPNNNGPISDIPREIQSLDMNSIAEIRKDSIVYNETSFNDQPSFVVSHEKTGSDQINGRELERVKGLHLSPPTSDYDLHTLSGSSLGYSEVDKTVKKINVDIDTIITNSKESLNHSFSPAHQSTHQGNHHARQFSTPTVAALNNSEPFQISSLPHYSSLDFGSVSQPNGQRHSVAARFMTPTHSPKNENYGFRERRSLKGSQSASNTPTHKLTFNNN